LRKYCFPKDYFLANCDDETDVRSDNSLPIYMTSSLNTPGENPIFVKVSNIYTEPIELCLFVKTMGLVSQKRKIRI